MSEKSKSEGTLTEDQKEIVREIVKQARGLGVDPRFAIALANLESTFRHVPADDEKSTAFGPFQVNKATAEANGVDYKAMQEDPKLAIRTGLLNIVRHAKNPELEGDPMRIAAAHRYGENSEYAKTGNPKGIDPTLRDYLVNVAGHFPEKRLPDVVFAAPSAEPAGEHPAAEPSAPEQKNELPPAKTSLPLPLQSAITGAVGSVAGPAAAVAHPLVTIAYDKMFGKESGELPSNQSPYQPRQVVSQTTPQDEFTRAEKQRLGAGDKSQMTGRESQTGYTEATAQQAARRKVQERLAGQVGLDVERPLAEYPNVASTKSGIVVTQDELNRQRAEVLHKQQLAEARQRVAQQLAAKNVQRVGAEWQAMQGQTFKPSVGSRVKEALVKAAASASPTSKTLPGALGRIGMGAGAALPYSVELYQHDYPKTAVSLPAISAALANKFPKTFGGLSALAALMSAGYAAAHPREFSGGLTQHDINPTAFIGMPEENLPAFPEYTGTRGGQ